jgi:diamine N-acetyltransferase
MDTSGWVARLARSACSGVSVTLGGVRSNGSRCIAAGIRRRAGVGLRLESAAVQVELREITSESVRAVLGLAVADDQRGFVADNARSIAQAHFEPRHWMRAVYLDSEPVGFLLTLEDATVDQFYLWRFMVDARWQRRGVARQAMHLLLERWRELGAREATLSVMPQNVGAIALYESLGFQLTGELAGNELVMRLVL